MVPILAILFFVSGISGLIYQLLWLRLLALVFGVTVYAAGTVLASFMAGLAVGGLLAARVADRARRPLLWFGVAEMCVGLSALLTPAALGILEQLYVSLHPLLSENLPTLTLIRFALSFAVLLPPTVLMGATLPLVVKSSLSAVDRLGERVALLYATNTSGAVVGTLLAGFYLIGHVGIAGSFRLAAGLNMFVAASAVLMSLSLKDTEAGREKQLAVRSDEPPANDDGDTLSDQVRTLLLVVSAISGFVALALEIIWFRVLVLAVPATTYAFTIMLATVLAGIAAGSYVVMPRVRRHKSSLQGLALLEMAIGVSAVLSIATLRWSYDALYRTGVLSGGEDAPLGPVSVASAIAIFPTSVLMGLAFPIALRLWASERGLLATHTAARVGIFYASNLAGAIGGATAGAFLILPLLGSRLGLVAVASLSMLAGVLLLTRIPRHLRGRWLKVGTAAVALFVIAATTVPNPFTALLGRRYRGTPVFWHEESAQTTASVHIRPMGARFLYLNGLHQASDAPDMVRVHRQIGQLPMALHPDPKEVLAIGLGGGVTAGAASRYPGSTVDVVELSAAVAHAATWFRHVNFDVLQQPNVRLRVDDGRNYLLLTRRRYDVITADIIQPIHAGAGHLYSAEYFRLIRRALKDDGLVLQWIGGRPEIHYKLIMRTFLNVFPHATLWAQGTLLVGANAPLRLDPARFARKLDDPALREVLESINLTSFQSLLSLYTAGPEDLRRFLGRGPILTDDRPAVEYFLSLPAGDASFNLASLRGNVRTVLDGENGAAPAVQTESGGPIR